MILTPIPFYSKILHKFLNHFTSLDLFYSPHAREVEPLGGLKHGELKHSCSLISSLAMNPFLLLPLPTSNSSRLLSHFPFLITFPLGECPMLSLLSGLVLAFFVTTVMIPESLPHPRSQPSPFCLRVKGVPASFKSDVFPQLN